MGKTITYEICGRNHIKNDIPCQDKAFSYKKNNVTVIALADGAGSAKYSELGAKASTKAIAEYLCENFEVIINKEKGEEARNLIIDEISYVLKNKANEVECDVKDLASTLLAVAVKDERVLIAHIGDGVIGYVKNGRVLVASHPNNGEFLNETIFTTSSKAASTMKLIKGNLKDITGFVLMSDGTSESFYHRRSKSLSSGISRIINWNTLFSEEKMYNLLSESFNNYIVKNTNDDCSIAIMSVCENKSELFINMDLEEKCDLLNLEFDCSAKLKNKLKKYENIYSVLDTPKTLDEISKRVYIKRKFIRRTLNDMVSDGLLEFNNGFYSLN